MQLEAQKLAATPFASLNWPDKVRRMRFIAPGRGNAHCLFRKGLILDGRAGLIYTLQRPYAESLLSLYLLKNDLTAAAWRKEGGP